MAWTTPKSWSTGYKVLASDMNAFVSDNDNALRDGGLAVTSQAANDILYASSSTQLARSASLAFNGTDLLVASEGVGTSVVRATLHMKPPGNNWEDSLLLEHNSGSTGWNFHPENNALNSLFVGYNANTAASLAGQSATTVMVLTSAGNVGVGTTAPGTAVAATGMVHSVNCVRAWARVKVENASTPGTPELVDSFNVASLTDNGVGLTTVVFTTALPHANYVALVTIDDDVPKLACVQSAVAGSVQVRTYSSDFSTLSDRDWYVAIISD